MTASYQSLSDAQVKKISEKYFVEREAKSQPAATPVIVFIGAQPGAGKSAAAELVRLELRRQGGYIHIDADRMREEIPISGGKPASEETQADAGKLANALRVLAIKGRRNIIEEGTLRADGVMAKAVKLAHTIGYKAELVAVATHPEESLLGVYERFEKQHLNPALNPRFVTDDYHGDAFKAFTDNMAKDANAFDRVRIISRDGLIFFDSAARENHHASAYEALIKGRELTPERLEAVLQGWERVRKLAESRQAPHEHLSRIEAHQQRVQDFAMVKSEEGQTSEKKAVDTSERDDCWDR